MECLLRNGGDGETVLIRHERTRRFVRFAKYRDASGAGGIALTFPEINWGKDYITRLRAYCAERGMPFGASADDNTAEPGMARIKLGDDLKGAWSLCKTIWHGYYGYGEDDPHTCIIGDGLTVLELTTPPGPETDRAETMARIGPCRRRLEYVGLAWLGLWGHMAVTVVSGFASMIAMVGLPAVTLQSVGEPPDWQFATGVFQAQGSIASLVFFLVYLVSYWVLRRCTRFVLIDWQNWDRIGGIVHRPRRVFSVAMPIAVLFIWMAI